MSPRSRFLASSPLILALLAFLLLNARLLPILAAPRDAVMLRSDERTYFTLAQNVVAGHGLSLSPGPPYEPSTARGPGYPFFLALLQWAGLPGPFWVGVAQAVLDTLAGILVALTARRIAGAVAGPIALVAWLLLGPGSGVASDAYTEVLAMTLSSGALVLLARLHGPASGRPPLGALAAFGAGTCLAVLTLTRPAQVVWIPLAIAVVAWETRSKWLTVAITLGAGLPMAAWLVRNLLVTGKPILLTTMGVGMNLWMGTVSNGLEPMVWVDDGAGGGRFRVQVRMADSDEEMRRVQALWNDYIPALVDGTNPEAGARAEAGFKELGLERWRRMPVHVLRLRAENLVRFANQPERRMGWIAGTIAWIGGLGFGVAAWRRGRASAWFVAAPLILAFAQIPLYSESRYVYPAYPMLVAMVAAGAAAWWGRRAADEPSIVAPGEGDHGRLGDHAS